MVEYFEKNIMIDESMAIRVGLLHFLFISLLGNLWNIDAS